MSGLVFVNSNQFKPFIWIRGITVDWLAIVESYINTQTAQVFRNFEIPYFSTSSVEPNHPIDKCYIHIRNHIYVTCNLRPGVVDYVLAGSWPQA